MKYYSLDEIKKKKAHYNFIYGGRASGKSYEIARELLDNYLKTGEQFVRVLRSVIYGKGCETYFTELIANNPDKYKGITVEYYQNQYTINGEIFGYTIPLTLEQSRKSSQYPNVTTMVFEEFTAIDNSDYIDNEIEHFKSLLSTVFRHRQGKVYFIGNSITLSNPYFDWFGIDAAGIEIGDIKCYSTSIELNGIEMPGASIALEYVPIGYVSPAEIPFMQRIPDNEIASTGAILESKYVSHDWSVVIDLKDDIPIGIRVKKDNGDYLKRYNCTCAIWKDGMHAYTIIQEYTGFTFVHGVKYPFSLADVNYEFVNTDTDEIDDTYIGVEENAPGGDITIITGQPVTEIRYSSQWCEYHFKQDRKDYLDEKNDIQMMSFGNRYGEYEEYEADEYGKNKFGYDYDTGEKHNRLKKEAEEAAKQKQYKQYVEQQNYQREQHRKKQKEEGKMLRAMHKAEKQSKNRKYSIDDALNPLE